MKNKQQTAAGGEIPRKTYGTGGLVSPVMGRRLIRGKLYPSFPTSNGVRSNER